MDNKNIIDTKIAEDLFSDISAIKFLEIFYKRKLFTLTVIVLFVFLSIAYSLSLPNIYRSNALLIPANIDSSISSKLSSYSNIAGLAGVSLNDEVGNKSTEAMYRINSLEFFSNHFLPSIKLENLLAIKKWDPDSNQVLYDPRLFDSKTSQWKKNLKFNKGATPSKQDAFKAYKEIISIEEDPKTKFVSISINHQSPIIAKEWLEIIISKINESMRNDTKELAKSSIEFLNNASLSTNVNQIKDAIANLLVDQMQTLMLTSSSEDYVYTIIDSPFIPEVKASPNRFLICLFGTLAGVFISIFLVLAMHLIQNYKTD